MKPDRSAAVFVSCVLIVWTGVATSVAGGFSCRSHRRCYTQCQPVPASVTISVDRKLVGNAHFLLFQKDVTGKSIIVADYDTLGEAMAAMERYWAAGDNTVYFQRAINPATSARRYKVAR